MRQTSLKYFIDANAVNELIDRIYKYIYEKVDVPYSEFIKEFSDVPTCVLIEALHFLKLNAKVYVGYSRKTGERMIRLSVPERERRKKEIKYGSGWEKLTYYGTINSKEFKEQEEKELKELEPILARIREAEKEKRRAKKKHEGV